jgi:hypothetical protein
MTTRQHYVPAGYLAGFTLGGKRDSIFFVHSFNGSPVRQDKPENVAFERDYNSIDADGLPKDHLEGIFNREFEGPACALFRTLSTNPRPFVTEEEVSVAIKFLALQAARVPLSKEKYERLIIENGRRFLNRVANDPEFVQGLVGAGVWDKSDVETAQQGPPLRELVESGEIQTEAGKTALSVGILHLTSAIVDKIVSMKVTLWITPGPDWFICSDHPVALFYSISGDVFDDPMALENPMVKVLADEIYMPIAKNVALVMHRLSDVPPAQPAHQQMVALVNQMTIMHAQRNIFSCTEDFICRLPGGRLGNAQQSVEALRSFRMASGSKDPSSTLTK